MNERSYAAESTSLERAVNGRLKIDAGGLSPAGHDGWIPRLPDHTDQPAQWVRHAVSVWAALAEESLSDGFPERSQALIPRSALAVCYGAVGATIVTRLLAERINEEGALQGYPLLPVLAMGSSFFRGGLRPDTVGRMLTSCPGVGGVIVDSIFEYGYDAHTVQSGVDKLLAGLTGAPHRSLLDEFDTAELEETAELFVTSWYDALPSLIKAARVAVRYVPTDLPGMQIHGELDISLFDSLTRLVDAAGDDLGVAFSGALYTLGLPPGFAGVGRVLDEIRGSRAEEVVLAVFPGLPDCVADTLRLVNQEVLEEAAEAWEGWAEIKDDFHAAAAWAHSHGVDLNEDAMAMTHRRATKKASVAVLGRKDPGEDLRVAARVRRFLG